MEHFPAAKETQPHGPADLTNQSTVFLMLEELGIASMQRDWLEANAPESDDCKDAAEQAEEFFDDIANLFLGQGGDDRVAPNGWAGSALTKNLREAVCAYAGHDVSRTSMMKRWCAVRWMRISHRSNCSLSSRRNSRAAAQR